MKACLFLLAVLAALVAVNDAAAIQNDAPAVQNDAPAVQNDAPAVQNDAAAVQDTVASGNLILGIYTSGDRLLHSRYYRVHPAGAPTNWVIPYLGATNVRITYIEAVQIGAPQPATATLEAGGIGFNHATIRLRSNKDFGFYYLVRIYGR